MKSTPFEQRLLRVYREAIRQDQWVVADHLLSAIEAYAPADAPMSEAVATAYGALAARVQRPTSYGACSRRRP